MGTATATQAEGKVIQIAGPAIDIQFPQVRLPGFWIRPVEDGLPDVWSECGMSVPVCRDPRTNPIPGAIEPDQLMLVNRRVERESPIF